MIRVAEAVGSLLSTTIIKVKLLSSFFVIGVLNLISGAGPGSGMLLSTWAINELDDNTIIINIIFLIIPRYIIVLKYFFIFYSFVSGRYSIINLWVLFRCLFATSFISSLVIDL